MRREGDESDRGDADREPRGGEEEPTLDRSGWKSEETRDRRARLIVALVLAILLIVFTAQNAQRVDARFLFFTWRTQVIWLMLACGLAGAALGVLLARLWTRSRARRQQTKPPEP